MTLLIQQFEESTVMRAIVLGDSTSEADFIQSTSVDWCCSNWLEALRARHTRRSDNWLPILPPKKKVKLSTRLCIWYINADSVLPKQTGLPKSSPSNFFQRRRYQHCSRSNLSWLKLLPAAFRSCDLWGLHYRAHARHRARKPLWEGKWDSSCF